MMAEGIRVKVDLIVGLPGDTVASVRRGMHYLRDGNLFNDIQVFNLAVLPGTAFREESEQLGLRFQPRPPYYVLQTPALSRTDLYELMFEAQEIFDVEFDAQPPPLLDGLHSDGICRIDLDAPQAISPRPDARRQAFTLWLTSADFDARRDDVVAIVRRVLADNPFTTLQVVLESSAGDNLTIPALEEMASACHAHPTYLDKYYALQPGGLNGAKRMVVIRSDRREWIPTEWIDDATKFASLVWTEEVAEEDLGPNEFGSAHEWKEICPAEK